MASRNANVRASLDWPSSLIIAGAYRGGWFRHSWPERCLSPLGVWESIPKHTSHVARKVHRCPNSTHEIPVTPSAFLLILILLAPPGSCEGTNTWEDMIARSASTIVCQQMWVSWHAFLLPFRISCRSHPIRALLAFPHVLGDEYSDLSWFDGCLFTSRRGLRTFRHVVQCRRYQTFRRTDSLPAMDDTGS